jgi:hypothetical protein
VLIYLEPAEAQAVLAGAAAMTAEAGTAAAVAIYEQTRPDDAFGSTMISNLEVGSYWMAQPAAHMHQLRGMG